MLHLPTVQGNLADYKDAGFPILYICTFEEAKADKYISKIAGRREVLEWNGSDGLVDFYSKVADIDSQTLEAALSGLKVGKELDRKLLVLKDVDNLIATDTSFRSDESNKITALLKDIARKIRNREIDASIIIISPIMRIPRELEKMITVLELELPDESEIQRIIKQCID